MDNLRTLFIFGLLIVSLLLWEAWQTDYVRPQQATQQTNNTESDTAQNSRENAADLPDLPTDRAPDGLPDISSIDNPGAPDNARQIRVKTDVIDAYIDPRGGDIRKLALLQYPVDADQPDVPVQF